MQSQVNRGLGDKRSTRDLAAAVVVGGDVVLPSCGFGQVAIHVMGEVDVRGEFAELLPH
jgi:hypothetical protein